MTAPKTLLELSGADLNPPKLADSCLVLIDIQNEYRSGPLALPDAEPAIAVAAKLLARTRQSGAAIFHIAHRGRAGSLFDREAERGAIVSSLTPLAGEPVIEKALPNAFAGTDLQASIAATGRTNIVLAGFMTHMCVSSTARAALDLGLRTTIAADACATRDLPDGRGGALSARTVHEVALAELSDRFAIVTQGDVLT
ncbi:cysteine hydrolase family protein [Bradyrhizobium cosmicum]|uniref:Isochorismatase n=1 Tax=Bradyrhizobium cosmicum TaxID=1404864 RepID=A0AAI8QC09_9BRAD|nr:cysteine hydrolase family protein [Bradyrhizobium cosmicum]BAL75834.1 putative isochorismatase [Bradyrhizobium cosmicum]